MPVSLLPAATGSLVYHFSSIDTIIRGIGKRAHVFHAMTFFSSQCVLGSTLGYAPASSLKNNLNSGLSSMILFKIPPVIPRRPLWLAVLLLIGIFGFIAQVCF